MFEFGRISPRVRKKMVTELQEKGIHNQRVLDAMQQVKRHNFIEPALHHQAYADITLPIGSKQTISQPYVVALMTQSIMGTYQTLKNVLEIGTGSGYQAAVLSHLAENVFSVERIKKLIPKAELALKNSQINNVYIQYGDGYLGWVAQAPFDVIIVTAASNGVPRILFDQLKIGGKIVIPVGDPVNHPKKEQDIFLITKTANEPEWELIAQIRFVPMIQGIG